MHRKVRALEILDTCKIPSTTPLKLICKKVPVRDLGKLHLILFGPHLLQHRPLLILPLSLLLLLLLLLVLLALEALLHPHSMNTSSSSDLIGLLLHLDMLLLLQKLLLLLTECRLQHQELLLDGAPTSASGEIVFSRLRLSHTLARGLSRGETLRSYILIQSRIFRGILSGCLS